MSDERFENQGSVGVVESELVTGPTEQEERMTSQYTELERIAMLEQRAKSNSHRLDNHDKQLELQQGQLDVLKQMNHNIESISNNMTEVRTEVTSVKSDVQDLKNERIAREAVNNYWTRFWASPKGKLIFEVFKYVLISGVIAYAWNWLTSK